MSKSIYDEVAEELNYNSYLVKDIFMHTWKFIKEKIEALDLKQGLTEEEFNSLRTSFNLMSLGKLGCDYNHYAVCRKNYLKRKRDAKIEKCQTVSESHNNNDGQV